MGERRARRIPTELETEVLQHIADEDEGDHSRWVALVNCALVCKAWTGHVRSHLYYAVDMSKPRGLLQFRRLREYTHLRPFLREFTWPRSRWTVSCNASDADIIKDIAPTATKLSFRRVHHQSLKPPWKEAMSTITNITELDMTGSIFENWTAVVRVVSKFPLLVTLAMPSTQDDDGLDGPDGPGTSYPPPSHLIHIKLVSGCETETVSWICRGSPIPNIQTVEAESKIDSSALAKLLRSLGRRLHHLIIHIDSNRACSRFRLASFNRAR